MRRNDNMRLVAGLILIVLRAQQTVLYPEQRVRNFLALGLGAVLSIQFFWLKRRRAKDERRSSGLP